MSRRGRHQLEDEDAHSRVICQLSSMIIHILRCPPALSFLSPFRFPTLFYSSDASPSPPAVSSSSSPPHLGFPLGISPASFASLFLGISLALMLFGSITFLIGFLLMPWVIAFVLVFYFVGVISTFSELGRNALMFWASSSPPPNVPAACKFL